MRQGVYREYQNFRHNDANLKGTIDIGRHIAKNVTFVGNIAYSTREYSHDNDLSELIRHTIEFMKTKRYGQLVLNIDCETIEDVKLIVEHTSSYNRNERNSIICKNL
uniref:5-methylcytosine restriction system specificity protein McrC n=1 Tax=Candidatus Cryptobacteroides bacterium TaxID=3085639 RepID=UPI003FEF6FD9